MSTDGRQAVPRMDELIEFNQQLMTLIEAGVPIELGDGSPSVAVPDQLSQIASRIALQVGLGKSVEQAMRGDSKVPSAYRAAWETWFHGNRPTEALSSLASQAETRREMQVNVGNSLLQPLILLSLVYVGFIYLAVIASRQLEATYQQLNEPPSTSLSFLIHARQWLPLWGWLLPLGVILCVAYWWLRSSDWSYRWLPGRKRYVESISKANYADNIAKLLEENHSLAESLQLVGPLESKSQLPSMLQWAFATKLEDPSRVNLLRFVARTYRDAARTEVKRWRNWLPVVASVFIGGSIVLGYGLSLFAPMIELLKTLTKP